MRESVAPGVLDIDGDSYHHIHNCTKKFTNVFEMYLEKLFHDLYNDIKWSEDLKEILLSFIYDIQTP